jgi:hypothetical protein
MVKRRLSAPLSKYQALSTDFSRKQRCFDKSDAFSVYGSCFCKLISMIKGLTFVSGEFQIKVSAP